jgi:hypothetical protein
MVGEKRGKGQSRDSGNSSNVFSVSQVRYLFFTVHGQDSEGRSFDFRQHHSTIRITLWSCCDPSPHRVQVEITREFEKVVIHINQEGFISSLKQMTCPSSF